MPVYTLKPETEGSVYYMWSTVMSPGPISANIYQSGLLPSKVLINSKQVKQDSKSVLLNKGNNPVLLKYNKIGRGYFVLGHNQNDVPQKTSVDLATRWYLNPGILPFVTSVNASNSFGWYRFKSPPGVRFMYLTSRSKPEVWMDGKKIECKPGHLEKGRIADQTLTTWKIELPELLPNSSTVAVRMEQLPG
jgi:hypothetical protein